MLGNCLDCLHHHLLLNYCQNFLIVIQRIYVPLSICIILRFWNIVVKFGLDFFNGLDFEELLELVRHFMAGGKYNGSDKSKLDSLCKAEAEF